MVVILLMMVVIGGGGGVVDDWQVVGWLGLKGVVLGDRKKRDGFGLYILL